MDAQSRDVVTWILGTVTALCVLGGFVVRFVILPWLQAHLVVPVRETREQVAENGHVDEDNPTIPDRLEDLRAQVASATTDHLAQARDVRALTRVLDEHLRWSNRWVDEVDDRLAKLSRSKGTEKRP